MAFRCIQEMDIDNRMTVYTWIRLFQLLLFREVFRWKYYKNNQWVILYNCRQWELYYLEICYPCDYYLRKFDLRECKLMYIFYWWQLNQVSDVASWVLQDQVAYIRHLLRLVYTCCLLYLTVNLTMPCKGTNVGNVSGLIFIFYLRRAWEHIEMFTLYTSI
jgi:hypothetical protein